MRIETFQMERMQCLYEMEVEYNLSESGVEPMTVQELVGGNGTRGLLEQHLGYGHSTGSWTLREQIADFYPGAGPENVTVVNGGSEANFVTLWSLLEGAKGDRLACMLPNYMQAWGMGRHFGAGSDAFRLRPSGSGAGRRWALDVDELNRAVTGDTKVILVTNPNNPTGAVLTEDEMDAVVRAARRARAWLVADEIYRGAEVNGTAASPTFWGRYEKLVVTSGLSKAFGLPGLRIGWMVAPTRAIEEFWRHHDYTTLSPGTLSERLATVATEPARREQIFARTRGIIRANLPRLEEWIVERSDVFTYIAPVAGAIAYMGYRLPIRSTKLVDRLRLEQSVLLCPGDQFGMGKYLRVGFGSDVEFTMKGMERVDAVLRRLAA